MTRRLIVSGMLLVGLAIVAAGCDDKNDGEQADSEDRQSTLSRLRDLGQAGFVEYASKKIEGLQARANQRLDEWNDRARNAEEPTQEAYEDARDDFQTSLDEAKAKLDQVRQSEDFKTAKASAIIAMEEAMEAWESLMEAGRQLGE